MHCILNEEQSDEAPKGAKQAKPDWINPAPGIADFIYSYFWLVQLYQRTPFSFVT